MRLSVRRRHGRSRALLNLGSAVTTAFGLWPSLTGALHFTPAPSSNLDLSGLGRIGIAGDFNGISRYEYEQQNDMAMSRNGSDSLWAPLPNGELVPIVPTDASIRAMCTFKLSTGKMAGVVMAGNFTSVDGTRTIAAALFNPDTGEVTPLDGLEGEVNAVYCDQENDKVFVGGKFKGASSSNAIAWYGNEGWTDLPFAGFNGPVEAITKGRNGNLIFGGSFTGLGNATQPRQRDMQVINLSTANVTAQNSASTDGYDSPRNIVCSDGSDAKGKTWLARDGVPAYWDASLGFGFEPTKLRLWNTRVEGRGTKTFRFISLNSNGIMNLTYIDPSTGKNQSCTNECPLSHDSNTKYQDFNFVNRKVGMNSFQIAISEWYGAGAGLAGIELFQDNIFSYAVEAFNEPSCRTDGVVSSATTTGPWKESPSGDTSSNYLTATLKGDNTPKSASVVFTPNIRQSGNYSIDIHTPGCKPDNTCDTRGRVNVTGHLAPGVEFSTISYQTNYFRKIEMIYFGYVEQTSDTFKPTITLTPAADQDANSLTVVAERVGFTLINSTGGLNGLYEFDPKMIVTDTANFHETAIDKIGTSFSPQSAVKALASSGSVTYVGGNFTSDEHVNIISITDEQQVASLDGGLNGQVSAMHLENDLLYVGGAFNNTLDGKKDGLNHVGYFDTQAKSWNALGAGVNGPVEFVVPMQLNVTTDKPETVIALSGSFSQVLASGTNSAFSASGFVIWVPSRNAWLPTLNLLVPIYSGSLTASLMDWPSGEPLYAGAVSSAQIGANGAATLSDNGVGRFPVNIQASQPSSQQSKRDEMTEVPTSGVATGIFYDDNGKNITVLAGHFSAKSSKGSTVSNLVFIDGNGQGVISGIESDISANATFAALAIHDSTLFAGGRVTGKVNGNSVGGMIAYDLDSGSLPGQPAPISGSNASVSVISPRPSSSEVYVGGSFEKAGALDCPGVCVYNVDTSQWNPPGNGFSGNVSSLLWASKSELLVGGDLRANGTSRRVLVRYDAKKATWTDFPGADAIPGPVQAMAPGSNDQSQLWISGRSSNGGSLYLMKFDGSKWQNATQSLSAQSRIQGLQVFSTTKNHNQTDLLDDNQVLMLTGSIVLSNFGSVSAVVFNGTDFTPYLLTTGSSNSGSISKIFSQKDNFFSSGGHHLAVGFVVLIGLAIALALVLLIVVGGIVLDRIRKRREGYTPAPTSMYDRGSGMQRVPPQELFQSLGRGRPEAPHI